MAIPATNPPPDSSGAALTARVAPVARFLGWLTEAHVRVECDNRACLPWETRRAIQDDTPDRDARLIADYLEVDLAAVRATIRDERYLDEVAGALARGDI